MLGVMNIERVESALSAIQNGLSSCVGSATLIVANLTPDVATPADAYYFERSVSWITQILKAEHQITAGELLDRLVKLSEVSEPIGNELKDIIARFRLALSVHIVKQAA